MQGLGGSLTNFPDGYAYGVSVRGFPVLNSYPGDVVWMGNATTIAPGCAGGADGNPGTWQRPLASLQGVMNRMTSFGTSGIGTIVAVKPGHSETISSSTALALNQANVTVLGMGVGNQRPLFTLDTANTATITVSADGVGFQNCRFVANFLNIAALFTLTTAKSFFLDSCSISDTSASLNFVSIVVVSTTSNAADGMMLTNNRIFSSAATGANNLVSALGTNAGWQINSNNYAAVTTNTGAVLPIATGKILTNFIMDNNLFSLVQTTGVTTGILITTNGSTNSGWLTRNFIQALDATSPILVTASSGFLFSQNYYQSAADKSGALLPADS